MLCYFIPLWIPSHLVLLRRDRHSSIPSVWICTPLFHSALYHTLSSLLSLRWQLLNHQWRSSVWIVTSIFSCTFLTPPPLTFSSTPQGKHSPIPIGAPLPGFELQDCIVHSLPPISGHLHKYGHSSIPVGTPHPRFGALLFILHSSDTFYVLPSSAQHSPSGAPFLPVVAPLFIQIYHISFQTPI